MTEELEHSAAVAQVFIHTACCPMHAVAAAKLVLLRCEKELSAEDSETVTAVANEYRCLIEVPHGRA